MSERQRRLWDGMVRKLTSWMDANDHVLPVNIGRPKDAAETAEKAIARTLDVLRGVQAELRASAPHLFSLLEEASCTGVFGLINHKVKWWLAM